MYPKDQRTHKAQIKIRRIPICLIFSQKKIHIAIHNACFIFVRVLLQSFAYIYMLTLVQTFLLVQRDDRSHEFVIGRSIHIGELFISLGLRRGGVHYVQMQVRNHHSCFTSFSRILGGLNSWLSQFSPSPGSKGRKTEHETTDLQLTRIGY